MSETTETKTCLYLDCGKAPYSRGLCESHYQQARRLVRLGKTSWAVLMADGQAAESRIGRPIPFTVVVPQPPKPKPPAHVYVNPLTGIAYDVEKGEPLPGQAISEQSKMQ